MPKSDASNNPAPLPSLGPFAYENWKAANAGQPSRYAYEIPLFTDADIVGTEPLGMGPYTLINNISVAQAVNGQKSPAIIVRIEDHCHHKDLWRGDPLREGRKDTTRYHGGDMGDELAALVSLSLGIRCKAGGLTRLFEPAGDPRGLPTAWHSDRDPLLAVLAAPSRNAIIPRALGQHALDMPGRMLHFPDLPPKSAVALIRAARQYQEAVWIAETAPELSWLFFVSAVESATEVWRGKGPPVDELRAWPPGPKLIDALLEVSDDFLVQRVANMLAKYVGSTKMFCSFLLSFMPEPPPDRPHAFYQVDWSSDALETSLRKIYGIRSEALHGGTPFPVPMCENPRPCEPNKSWSEKPPGLGYATLGAAWQPKDIPMLLHTFEYMVRGALLRWWDSMVPTSIGHR